MRKYTKRQKNRIVELNARTEFINDIIYDTIDGGVALPLDYILEARFNQVQINGIKLEAELAYLIDKDELDEKAIYDKRRRLDVTNGMLQELKAVREVVYKMSRFGQEFEIVGN